MDATTTGNSREATEISRRVGRGVEQRKRSRGGGRVEASRGHGFVAL